jgi:ATP synthase protein I
VAENDPGREPQSVDDPRLTALDERLREARRREALRTGQAPAKADGGYSQGNRVIAALIGSLVGSALIGWLIDQWMGNAKPWALIVMLFLGIAVAFRQIIRISGERPE